MAIELKFTKRHVLAQDPTRGSASAAAFDLYAATCTIGHYFTEYDTGVEVEIPEGHAGLLFSRSSVSQTGMWLANGTGLIDSDFRGTIKARFYRSKSEYYDIGDRIAQLMIIKLPEVKLELVDGLSITARGAGSFGSSGR